MKDEDALLDEYREVGYDKKRYHYYLREVSIYTSSFGVILLIYHIFFLPHDPIRLFFWGVADLCFGLFVIACYSYLICNEIILFLLEDEICAYLDQINRELAI